MAEVARINRMFKERSEIQSQKMKSFFDKMPDPKQMLADQDRSVEITPEEPVVPVPAVPVPVAPEPAETSRSETASHNLLFSTLHQSMNINLDVRIHLIRIVKSLGARGVVRVQTSRTF